MTALALALHILGAVVWVGGMFAAYMCLRPAAGPLDPPVRLKLWSAFFQKFFPFVWIAILLLLASGYWMLFTTFGGRLVMTLHQPNRRVERARFFEMEDTGETIRIRREITNFTSSPR